MITLPQGDLPKPSGILRTAAQHNAVHVGVFTSVVNGGTTRRGDPGILDALAFFMSSTGVPAEPWEAVEFHAVNGEIVSESGEADEHKAYAMEAARRSAELTRSLNSEEFEEEEQEEEDEEFLGPLLQPVVARRPTVAGSYDCC
jgi:hypothetical protein